MKIRNLRPSAVIALGVFLGRAAQADTIVDFDSKPPEQAANDPLLQSWGDNASVSSEGVTVAGFGTPNIGLTWGVGALAERTAWDYYSGGPWVAAQLAYSDLGTFHQVNFAPNHPDARVVIKSFNLHPYYDFAAYGEVFTYDVTVVSGTGSTVLSGPVHISFRADATKEHPVNINYTGAPGQTLRLRIARVPGTPAELTGGIEGYGGDIALDDLTFAQLPETELPASPEVVSVAPLDGQRTSVGAPFYPFLAKITQGTTTLDIDSIQLKLDGSVVAPSLASEDNLTLVGYEGTTLLSSALHTYTLTYKDVLGASFTNEVQFTPNHLLLPATYALPPGAGIVRGFTTRTVSASTEAPAPPNHLEPTIARAKAQLNGTLINPLTSAPFTNSAAVGPNADGSFDIDAVLNFNDNGVAAGNFGEDAKFPGLEEGPNESFSTEALLYLDLPAGYYRFGVNSDDGFEVSAVPPAGVSGSPLVAGLFDGGRGVDNTLFDILVQTSGLYPFRLIFFEGYGDASCEFFSVTDLATGDKLLINDPADGPGTIKSYRVLRPVITSAVRSGTNLAISWAYGVPPFQVQVKTSLTDPTWTDSGATTMLRTADVPIQPGTGFIRVVGR